MPTGITYSVGYTGAPCHGCGKKITKGQKVVNGSNSKGSFRICITCFIKMYDEIMLKDESVKEYKEIAKAKTQVLHIKNTDPIIKHLCIRALGVINDNRNCT